MQDKIEAFLYRNSTRLFTPTEIAEAVGTTVPSAQRRLKMLHQRKKVVWSKGRYRVALSKMRSGESATTISVEEVAMRVGIDAKLIRDWIYQRKNRAVEEELKRILYAKLKENVESLVGRRGRGKAL